MYLAILVTVYTVYIAYISHCSLRAYISHCNAVYVAFAHVFSSERCVLIEHECH